MENRPNRTLKYITWLGCRVPTKWSLELAYSLDWYIIFTILYLVLSFFFFSFFFFRWFWINVFFKKFKFFYYCIFITFFSKWFWINVFLKKIWFLDCEKRRDQLICRIDVYAFKHGIYEESYHFLNFHFNSLHTFSKIIKIVIKFKKLIQNIENFRTNPS